MYETPSKLGDAFRTILDRFRSIDSYISYINQRPDLYLSSAWANTHLWGQRENKDRNCKPIDIKDLI